MPAEQTCASPAQTSCRSIAGRRLWPRAPAIAAAIVLSVPAAPARSGEPLVAHQYAQLTPTGPARLVVPPALNVQPASSAQLDIRVAAPGELPQNSYVRLRGLPPTMSLSDGHAIAAGAWAVPLSALARLRVEVPAGLTGRSELTVSLVNMDGDLLAEARMTLVITGEPARTGAAPAAPPPPPSAEGPTPAPAAKPKAAAAVPMLTPEDRERAEKLTARGERDLAEGNIASARNFFLRAAEAGLARGALLLAATYDPRELARMRTQGIQPNPAEARKWYERARELGAPEASERLSRLGGS